jgi:hypothetical protein
MSQRTSLSALTGRLPGPLPAGSGAHADPGTSRAHATTALPTPAAHPPSSLQSGQLLVHVQKGLAQGAAPGLAEGAQCEACSLCSVSCNPNWGLGQSMRTSGESEGIAQLHVYPLSCTWPLRSGPDQSPLATSVPKGRANSRGRAWPRFRAWRAGTLLEAKPCSDADDMVDCAMAGRMPFWTWLGAQHDTLV